MLIVLFVGVLVVLMLCGVPVAFSMAATAFVSAAYLWGFEGVPLHILIQQTVSGVNSFTSLAIPLFLLAGQLMNGSDITNRIFDFCQSCVGSLRGGLGHVNILCSVIFAGMSGTAAADAAGLGTMEIKAMTDAGFDKEFSVAVTGASSLIGPIIPPSVPMVMYGVIAGVSVSSLFIGGILPGILMALGMMVMVYIYSVKRNYPRGEPFSIKRLGRTFRHSILSLMTPVIIIGGIWSGVFTATEASAVAVLYASVLALFVYRDMKLSQWIGLLRKSVLDCASIMLVLGCVSLYGYVLTRTRIPVLLAQSVISMTTDKVLVTVILLVFLLFIGCFMSTTECVLLFTPIFLPLMQQVGINITVFGIVMCLVLMIGQITPPFGTCLFILCKNAGLGMDVVVKHTLPLTIPVLVTAILCLIFPGLVTFLPGVFS